MEAVFIVRAMEREQAGLMYIKLEGWGSDTSLALVDWLFPNEGLGWGAKKGVVMCSPLRAPQEGSAVGRMQILRTGSLPYTAETHCAPALQPQLLSKVQYWRRLELFIIISIIKAFFVHLFLW
jgi:hypothetical protein